MTNNNIIWKTKYTTYPFEFPDKITGNIIVKDKGGIEIYLDNNIDEKYNFKNLEKAIKFVSTELLQKHLN